MPVREPRFVRIIDQFTLSRHIVHRDRPGLTGTIHNHQRPGNLIHPKPERPRTDLGVSRSDLRQIHPAKHDRLNSSQIGGNSERLETGT